MAVVGFVFKLVPGDPYMLSVYNYYIVSSIHMWGVLRLMFTFEPFGNLAR